ncbi:YybH family protein [Cryptosporangium aurantiacum]|uniref:DUF4440 domain-containing protein n=1 Tax=Cryptosporangium aurantiacum TaxID=134849 RepID=A0A1M7RMQ5_9ACTN|nr:SgcJ/EcaC family oxidoreductase [Cryptosporangium aurantiacum]SHN47524.1 conserved hypothetical protein [Cryptosporangium aurantiacum]
MTEAPPQLTQPLDADDVTALRRIVQDVEDGFNTNEPALLSVHIAEDAVIGTAGGAWVTGRAAIDEANRAGLAGFLRDATAHYEVSGAVAVAPDVAVAQKRAWSTRAAAEAGEPPEMLALYVFVRRDGRWWIVRRQNTLVP